MAQVRMFIPSVMAAALTLGINGQAIAPVDHEKSLSTSDIVIATNEKDKQGNEAAMQTDENAKGSAKMGQDEGTQVGADEGGTSKEDTQKIDQAARQNPTTNN